ncbi:MAG TPA: PAS domain S-box protein, partial [Anaerolineae bacterium]|nr:PAS domain S-box protein [Anaerolineae bacterium]
MQDDVRKARLQRIVGEVIETIPDAVTVTDENGVIIFANSAAEKILGLSRDDIVGRAYNDVRWNITTLDGGPLPQEEYPFSRVMQEKKTIYGIEYGIERSDGTRLIVSVNAAPLGDEHGAIVGVVAAFTDITEQKRAEDELKRARSELEREVKERTEELSRANATLQQEIIHREQAAEEIRESRREILGILESITDGFFALDNLWRFTYVNKRAEELLQRKKEELLFKNIWEVLPELVDTRFYKEYHRVKEEMTPVSFEARYPQLHRWFEVRVYPYENGLSVYFSDITERKKTEEEVRFKSTLLDSTADSVFVFTLDGKMIFANEAAYKTRGYETEEELLNIPLEKLIAPEYRDLIESRTERMRKGGATFESAHLRKDGTAFPVEVRSRVIDLEGNKVIVSVIRDITGRKRIEDALRTSKTLSDALNDISTSIIATLNFDEIMQRVIIESTKAIGAETAGIDLREDGLWVMRYVYGLPQELLGTHFTDKDFKGSVAAARTREPIVINDAFHDEMANRELVERYNIRSMLIVP